MTHIVNVIYRASSGNEYNLQAKRKLRIKKGNFHKYEWKAIEKTLTLGSKINGFTKEPVSYETTLVFQEQDKELREKLHDDFDSDITNMTPGVIIWGDYYINCYITSSSTYPDENIDRWTDNDILIYCPYPFWIKEQDWRFEILSVSSVQSDYLDYKMDFPYEFTSNNSIAKYLINDSQNPVNFKMIIYGKCSNPMIQIGGHTYQVNTTVGENEYLVIDSKNHTIHRVLMYGTKVNEFNNRYKRESVFEKIKPGKMSVVWSGAFALDIILMYERSEPAWS